VQFDGDVASIRYPDGTMEIHGYTTQTNGNIVTTISRGQPDQP